MSKSILVTGGAGYIGSFMTKKLIDEGYNVVVIDSLERGHRDAVDTRAALQVGNILDRTFVENVIKSDTFDAVIHFAGYISVPESMENPYIYFENNTIGTLTLLETMAKNNLKHIIFSSTAAVYGNPVVVPIPEDHEKFPTNPYGESKLMIERLLSWYEKIHGFRYVALRYFNASGAAVDGSLGESHDPETHIIPSALHALLNHCEFILYGDDYNTPDNTCIRDYIHVLDLCHAHILALEKIRGEKRSNFYNVGTGKGYSNREVIEMIEKVTGEKIKVKVEKRRPGDPDRLVANPTRIQQELRFKPSYSDLETIVKSAWEWHKRNSKLKTQNSK